MKDKVEKTTSPTTAVHDRATSHSQHQPAGGLADWIAQSPRMQQQKAMIQAMFGPVAQRKGASAQTSSPTSLPQPLKTGIETLSGLSMENVRVRYNSDVPAQLNALAYAQGNEIHLGPGQERHLPHEAWHVVQQAQGRVSETRQMAGFGVNDEAGLEREANVMGSRAAGIKSPEMTTSQVIPPLASNRVTRSVITNSLSSSRQFVLGAGAESDEETQGAQPNTTLTTKTFKDKKLTPTMVTRYTVNQTTNVGVSVRRDDPTKSIYIKESNVTKAPAKKDFEARDTLQGTKREKMDQYPNAIDRDAWVAAYSADVYDNLENKFKELHLEYNRKPGIPHAEDKIMLSMLNNWDAHKSTKYSVNMSAAPCESCAKNMVSLLTHGKSQFRVKAAKITEDGYKGIEHLKDNNIPTRLWTQEQQQMTRTRAWTTDDRKKRLEDRSKGGASGPRNKPPSDDTKKRYAAVAGKGADDEAKELKFLKEKWPHASERWESWPNKGWRNQNPGTHTLNTESTAPASDSNSTLSGSKQERPPPLEKKRKRSGHVLGDALATSDSNHNRVQSEPEATITSTVVTSPYFRKK